MDLSAARSCLPSGGVPAITHAPSPSIPVSEELPPLVDDRQQDLANRDLIDRALRRLTVDERTVLVMRHYLDMSLVEAADALGIPLGTMKSRLSRATAAMRTALEADARTPAGGELIR